MASKQKNRQPPKVSPPKRAQRGRSFTNAQKVTMFSALLIFVGGIVASTLTNIDKLPVVSAKDNITESRLQFAGMREADTLRSLDVGTTSITEGLAQATTSGTLTSVQLQQAVATAKDLSAKIAEERPQYVDRYRRLKEAVNRKSESEVDAIQRELYLRTLELQRTLDQKLNGPLKPFIKSLPVGHQDPDDPKLPKKTVVAA